MQYYFVVLLPPFCTIVGIGWLTVWRKIRPRRWVAGLVLFACLAFTLRLSYGPAFVTPEEDQSVPIAAEIVREMTEPGEPIVTIHGTGIDLLYHCDRPGWALAADQKDPGPVLENCRDRGARVLVVVGPFCEEIHRLVEPALQWEKVSMSGEREPSFGIYLIR